LLKNGERLQAGMTPLVNQDDNVWLERVW